MLKASKFGEFSQLCGLLQRSYRFYSFNERNKASEFTEGVVDGEIGTYDCFKGDVINDRICRYADIAG
ncbi:MAG: hypothetical protein EZS28_024446 [Streblomastix strix]|uniref:Uncharacterized protein n=1 Tax=Streblomastix strix TaxID=222440 RepID=A0A5J4VBS8_9EUKA|nr:MAG: hypothetical protein EZS28_024446 [Streblomastix strix]